MRKEETVKTKRILRNVDKAFVLELLGKVNLTQRELKIVKDTELERKTIKEMSVEMNVSLSYISVIKKSAMDKIYRYCLNARLVK